MPALGAVLTNASAFAADVLPAGWAARTWSLPKTMFLVDSSKEDKAVWAAGIKPLIEKGAPDSSRFDVREFLAARRLQLPSNAIAVYDESETTLMVIAPRADIATLESALTVGHCWSNHSVEALFTLVTFENPKNIQTNGISATALRKVAGHSWREEERMTMLARSGQRSIAVMRTGTESAGSPDTPLAANEHGMQTELEAVLGPDGFTIETNLAVSRRGPIGADKAPLNFEVNNSFVIGDSAAIVAQVWPVVREGAKGAPLQAALLLRLRMLNEHGQPLRETFQRAKK